MRGQRTGGVAARSGRRAAGTDLCLSRRLCGVVHQPPARGIGGARQRRDEGGREMNRAGSRGWAAAGLAARWVVGGLYVWMGWSKVTDPVGFLKLLHQYHLSDTPLLLNLVA